MPEYTAVGGSTTPKETRYKVLVDGVELTQKNGKFKWDTGSEVGALQMAGMTPEQVQALVDEKKIEPIV